MNKSQQDGDFKVLLSSYGIMTAERILEKFGIQLSQKEILAVVKTPHCLYHSMLDVPFKLILDGIILQQADDYYVYAQKLFIDYLLSGETGKTDDMPGTSTRELLEEQRLILLEYGEEFYQLKADHDKLIASSQKTLIKFSTALKIASNQSIKQNLQLLHATGIDIISIEKALNHTLIYADLSDSTAFITRFANSLGITMDNQQKNNMSEIMAELNLLINSLADQLSPFKAKINVISEQISLARAQFYNLILATKELITLLPDYKHDHAQENKNKEALYFDNEIGEAR